MKTDDDIHFQEKVDMSTTDVWPKRHVSNGLCCVLLWVSLLVFLGLVVGMMLYQQYVRPSPVRRYQAFCSIPIPIPNDLKEASVTILGPYSVKMTLPVTIIFVANLQWIKKKCLKSSMKATE